METSTILPQFLTGDLPVATLVADAFASIEKHDLRVAAVCLHPSIYHRFALSLSDIFDVSPEGACPSPGIVGTLWGAEVRIDPEAPYNGFALKSEDGSLTARFVGPDAPKAVTVGTPVVFCKSPVRAQSIMTLLDMGRPLGSVQGLRLEMTPRTYMDLRKFGREILDLETRASELKKGIQGAIYGVTLLVSRTAHPIQMVLRDDDRVYGILETDPDANPALKELTDKVLSGDIPEAILDNLTAGMKKGFDEAWRDLSYSFDSREEAAKAELFGAVVPRLVALALATSRRP